MMLLTRRHLPTPLENLRDEMDRWFHDFLNVPAPADTAASPSVDVWEDERAFHVEAELPGFKLEEIEILLQDNELHLKAEHLKEPQQKEGDKDRVWHRRERITRSYRRTLRLPFDVETEKVEAKLENGVLNVVLPKAEASRPRRIEVKAK